MGKTGMTIFSEMFELVDPQEALAKADNPVESVYYSQSDRVSHKWHHYLSVYDRHLSRFRDRPVRLLEIGIHDGGSLQMWRRYLGARAIIHALDINPKCAEIDDPDLTIHIGSQADASLLHGIVEAMGGVDIVIDDGSHVWWHQIATFEALYAKISENGVYICEDTHTSYWPEYRGDGSDVSFLAYHANARRRAARVVFARRRDARRRVCATDPRHHGLRQPGRVRKGAPAAARATTSSDTDASRSGAVASLPAGAVREASPPGRRGIRLLTDEIGAAPAVAPEPADGSPKASPNGLRGAARPPDAGHQAARGRALPAALDRPGHLVHRRDADPGRRPGSGLFALPFLVRRRAGRARGPGTHRRLRPLRRRDRRRGRPARALPLVVGRRLGDHPGTARADRTRNRQRRADPRPGLRASRGLPPSPRRRAGRSCRASSRPTSSPPPTRSPSPSAMSARCSGPSSPAC